MVAMGTAANLPAQLAQRDRERLRKYREHLDFYHGKQWAGTARRRERRLTYNYARAFVDKVTSYLMVGFDFAVDPTEATEAGHDLARRSEAALRLVHEDNNLDQLDFETELDCAILGDAAYKVTWDVGEARVVVTAPDVAGLYCWWRADNLTRLTRVAQRWEATAVEASEALGRPVVVSRRDGRVSIIEDWAAATLALWVDGRLVEERPNPYGLIPYVVFANLREAKGVWGVSDIEALREPQREINRALSQLSAIMELSGNPIAVLENVQESSDIAVAPGAVWEIPADAKAYLLDLLKGGVDFHKEYVGILYRALHDLGETPRTAFGENRFALSGVALNTELDPLLKKVERKRVIRSAAYRRRNEIILRLLERFTGETFAPYRSRVVWGPVLPQDRSRQVGDERALVEAGIHSRKRAADALGVEDPEAEFGRWLAEEERARAIGSRGAEGFNASPGTGR